MVFEVIRALLLRELGGRCSPYEYGARVEVRMYVCAVGDFWGGHAEGMD